MATKTEATARTTLLTVVQTARADLKSLFDRGIDLAEKRTRSVFRAARSLTKRIGGTRPKTKRRS